MASEIQIVHWCDVHYKDGEKVEPTFTITLSAGDQRNMKVELCDAHNTPIPLAMLEQFLADFGTPDKDVRPGPKAPASRAFQGEGEHDCPKCGAELNGRNSLTAHARHVHKVSLSELETSLGLPISGNYAQRRRATPVSCEVCGRVFKGPQGLGSHQQAQHGMTSKRYDRERAAQPALSA